MLAVAMAEVVSIHMAGEPNSPARELSSAQVVTDHGIEGDWRSRSGNSRQLTLIEEEALLAIGRDLGSAVPDGASRRQVVVRGLTLNSTVGQTLRMGPVLVAVTALCHPCENMERTIGPGAQAAMANRGGVSARILQGGTLRPGDQVSVQA